jgi:hypothetical protein
MGEKIMAEMSDFQKSFLSKGTGNRLFTQEEFDAELQAAQAEIVAMAITATKEAIRIEREACAQICEKWAESMSGEPEMLEIAKEIRNRVQAKIE